MLVPPAPGRGAFAYETYDRLADTTAATVIGTYSSSFGLATRLLARPLRRHVRNVYALVRVADEVVDAPRPDGTAEQQAAALATLRAETLRALATGQSANLVVHAFARTAREVGITAELVEPFFASMRSDLDRPAHDEESLATYIHGSAEVVGLMCLRAFLAGEPDAAARYDRLAPGACRLGAAFQKVNFVRDLGDDHDALGRSYFPDVDPRGLTDDQRDALLDDVDADLRAAAAAVALLPASSRRAVCAAHDLFAELSARLRRTPAIEIRTTRVRVPDPVKVRLVAGVVRRDGMPR